MKSWLGVCPAQVVTCTHVPLHPWGGRRTAWLSPSLGGGLPVPLWGQGCLQVSPSEPHRAEWTCAPHGAFPLALQGLLLPCLPLLLGLLDAPLRPLWASLASVGWAHPRCCSDRPAGSEASTS